MGETRRHEGPIKGEIGRFAKSNRFHSVRTSGAAFETHTGERELEELP